MTDAEYALQLAQVGKLRQRAAPRNETAAARIRGFGEGLTGAEALSGSPFDGDKFRDEAEQARHLGKMLNLFSDMPGPGTAKAMGGAGAAALKASFLVPILAGRNKLSAKHGADLERRAMSASQMAKAGADEDTIWRDLQVSPVRRTAPEMRGPYQGAWAHEVDRGNQDIFEPYASMAPNDKIDLMHKWEGGGKQLPTGTPFANLMKNSAPLPVKGTIGDELDLGSLTQEYPELGKMGFEAFPDMKTGLNQLAVYNRDTNTVKIHPGTLIRNGAEDPGRATVHEIGHGIQEAFGAPGGSNAAARGMLGVEQAAAFKIVDQLRNSGDPTLERMAGAIKHNITQTPQGTYQKVFGEADARNMSTRDLLTSAQKASQSPRATLDRDPNQLVEHGTWNTLRQLVNPANSWSMQSPDKQTAELVRALRAALILP